MRKLQPILIIALLWTLGIHLFAQTSMSSVTDDQWVTAHQRYLQKTKKILDELGRKPKVELIKKVKAALLGVLSAAKASGDFEKFVAIEKTLNAPGSNEVVFASDQEPLKSIQKKYQAERLRIENQAASERQKLTKQFVEGLKAFQRKKVRAGEIGVAKQAQTLIGQYENAFHTPKLATTPPSGAATAAKRIPIPKPMVFLKFDPSRPLHNAGAVPIKTELPAGSPSVIEDGVFKLRNTASLKLTELNFLAGDAPFTIAYWVVSTSGSQRIFTGPGISHGIYNGGAKGAISGGGVECGAAFRFSEKSLVHLCLVYDKRTLTIYINGKKNNEIATPKPFGLSKNLTFGGGSDEHRKPHADIDNFLLFREALSAPQVAWIFELKPSLSDPSQ